MIAAIASRDLRNVAKALIPSQANLDLQEIRAFDVDGRELIRLAVREDFDGVDLPKSARSGLSSKSPVAAEGLEHWSTSGATRVRATPRA